MYTKSHLLYVRCFLVVYVRDSLCVIWRIATHRNSPTAALFLLRGDRHDDNDHVRRLTNFLLIEPQTHSHAKRAADHRPTNWRAFCKMDCITARICQRIVAAIIMEEATTNDERFEKNYGQYKYSCNSVIKHNAAVIRRRATSDKQLRIYAHRSYLLVPRPSPTLTTMNRNECQNDE